MPPDWLCTEGEGEKQAVHSNGSIGTETLNRLLV